MKYFYFLINYLFQRNHMLFGNKRKPLTFSKANHHPHVHHSPHHSSHQNQNSNSAAQNVLHSLYDTLNTSQFNSIYSGGGNNR